MKDYYNILGVSRTASDFDIKKAYRKLVLIYHPDRNNGSKLHEKIFIEIKEAYEVLSDTARRTSYDYEVSHETLHPPKKDKFDAYHEAYRKKYEQRKDAVPNRSSLNPYLIVFAMFTLLLVISFLITPKEKTYPNGDSFTYTVRDSNGVIVFESNDSDEIRDYLQKKYRNDTRFIQAIDSIIHK